MTHSGKRNGCGRLSLPLFGVLFLVTLSSVDAFEPVYKIGGYGRVDGYSDEADPYSLVGLEFTAGQRGTFDAGYWSWYAAALLHSYLSGADEFEDLEQVSVDLHVDQGNFAWETGGTFKYSANTIDYDSVIQPSWSGSLVYTADSGPFFGSLDYSGSSVSQESGTGDRLTNRVGLTLGYDHSLTLGLSGTFAAALSSYREAYLLDENNMETDTLRADRRLEGELSAEGLLGFFSDWEGSLYLHYYDSNAQRWLEAVGELEQDSEDRWMAGLEYELNWSPHRSIQFGLSGFTDYSAYLHRAVIDTSGISTGEELGVLRTGGSLKASWTGDGSSYWTVELSTFRSFADDPEFDLWSGGLAAGLEFLF